MEEILTAKESNLGERYGERIEWSVLQGKPTGGIPVDHITGAGTEIAPETGVEVVGLPLCTQTGTQT